MLFTNDYYFFLKQTNVRLICLRNEHTLSFVVNVPWVLDLTCIPSILFNHVKFLSVVCCYSSHHPDDRRPSACLNYLHLVLFSMVVCTIHISTSSTTALALRLRLSNYSSSNGGSWYGDASLCLILTTNITSISNRRPPPSGRGRRFSIAEHRLAMSQSRAGDLGCGCSRCRTVTVTTVVTTATAVAVVGAVMWIAVGVGGRGRRIERAALVIEHATFGTGRWLLGRARRGSTFIPFAVRGRRGCGGGGGQCTGVTRDGGSIGHGCAGGGRFVPFHALRFGGLSGRRRRRATEAAVRGTIELVHIVAGRLNEKKKRRTRVKIVVKKFLSV